MTDLIIFDCDGVLIDSEVLSAEVLISLLAEQGHHLTVANVRQKFLGRSFPTVAASLRQDFGVSLPHDFEMTYRARLLARFEGELCPTEGVVEMLSALDVPFCLATSSSPPRLKHSLELTGLAQFFGPRCYTASMVARGKPAPDLFLHAAEMMGFAPGRCLVVEDSLPGVKAAQAAGMAVVVYTGGGHMDGQGLDTCDTIPQLETWSGFDDLRRQFHER
ncbi:HAD family hydrolase [Roseinatronobacter monicus]|uniref:HAD superfamily hydrolase (TIGR01509 family) n=1 Tax=Roseinatronobacter monicus TaxID=393481 RepID=A0A543K3L7_9RHOB|nr:HAD family hydrolase [Roseinatronobacter monicus]TQM89659.1 HAD superfamily hydrolase (TIGR01509 family) [Roseinatronobacter monicus]